LWCRFNRFGLLNPAARLSFRPVHPKIVAAPIAYEQPTLNKAWETYLVNHFPVFLFVWVASMLVVASGFIISLLLTIAGNSLSGLTLEGALGSAFLPSSMGAFLGQLGQIPFSIVSNLLGVLFAAIPAIYYSTGEPVTFDVAFSALMARPWRYILAGALYLLLSSIGFLLCFLPGLAVALVLPVYVSKIFTTEMSILDAFSSSFKAVYRSENGWTFVGIELLAWLLVSVVVVCTCGVGLVFAPAVASFYVQNAAYRQGVLT
jgi:hypothetical protein